MDYAHEKVRNYFELKLAKFPISSAAVKLRICFVLIENWVHSFLMDVDVDLKCMRACVCKRFFVDWNNRSRKKNQVFGMYQTPAPKQKEKNKRKQRAKKIATKKKTTSQIKNIVSILPRVSYIACVCVCTFIYSNSLSFFLLYIHKKGK